MIKSINYTLVKKEGTMSQEVFHPNEILEKFAKNNSSRILRIKASNSLGKSFLLNLIAYASFGSSLKDEDLMLTLRNSIKEIADESDKTLEFELKIMDADGRELRFVKSKKKGSNPIVQLSNKDETKQLSVEEFTNNYKLIYDIPEKPLHRIYQIVRELKSKNQIIYRWLDQSSQKLNLIVNSLNNQKDLLKLQNWENEKLQKQKQIDHRKADYEILRKKYLTISTYNTLQLLKRNIDATKSRIKELKNCSDEFAKMQAPKEKNQDEKFQNIIQLEKQIKDLKIDEKFKFLKESLEGEYKSSFDTIDYQILSNIENLLSNYLITFKTYNQEEISKIVRVVGSFATMRLEQLIFKSVNKNKDKDEFIFVNDFKSILEEISKENFKSAVFQELFSFEIGTALEKINSYSESFNDFKKMDVDFRLFNSLLSDISKQLKEGEVLSKKLNSIRSKIKSDPIEFKRYNTLKEKIETITSDLSKLNQKARDYRNFLESSGVLKNEIESRVQIEQQIQNLQGAFQNISYSEEELNNQLEEKDKQLLDFNKEIDELSYRITHESEKKTSILSDEKSQVTFLNSKLLNFLKWIHDKDDLIKDDGLIKNENPSESDEKYIKLIGIYVASSMGNKIIYQKGYQDIQYIDYLPVTPVFITNSGMRISFSDFSGGQQSSNYLKAKLNSNDNRKYIVLFDEVANMDNESINNVVQRLKELEREKKLVLAVLVQPFPEPNKFEIETY